MVGVPAAILSSKAVLRMEAFCQGRWNTKTEDNEITDDCGASIPAVDCLFWDFYGKEKHSKKQEKWKQAGGVRRGDCISDH